MWLLLFLQTAEQQRALETLEGMNRASPEYIVGYAINGAIFDSAFVVVVLTIISIVRFFVRRRKLAAT